MSAFLSFFIVAFLMWGAMELVDFVNRRVQRRRLRTRLYRLCNR